MHVREWPERVRRVLRVLVVLALFEATGGVGMVLTGVVRDAINSGRGWVWDGVIVLSAGTVWGMGIWPVRPALAVISRWLGLQPWRWHGGRPPEGSPD